MKKKILSILTAVAVLGVTACTAALNSSAYSGEISFEVPETWANANKTFYAHIWNGLPGGEVRYEWQTADEKMKWSKGDDKATYQVPEGDWNLIIISGNTGIQTYDSVMNANCIGDTCYVMDERFENPIDSKRVSYGLGWRNNPDCGPHKVISSLGNIIGNAYLPGETNQMIYDNFVKKYADTWGIIYDDDIIWDPEYPTEDPDWEEKWEALKQEVAEKLGLNTKTDKSKEYKSIVVTSDSNYAGFLSAILMADTGAALRLVKKKTLRKKHNSDLVE